MKGGKGIGRLYSVPEKNWPHCKEDPIYVFPEMKLRGLVPNFHIYVSVSDLHNPRIGQPFWEYLV